MSRSSDRARSGEWQVRSLNTGTDEPLGGVLLDDFALAQRLGRSIPPAIADLVELTSAVHLVDRSCRRPSASRAGDCWSRFLHVRLGVRDIARWANGGLVGELEDFLRRLTDDTWRFEFVPRVAPARPAESISFLFESPPGADVVALYSGGLDSIAGLLIDVAAGITPLLVSAETNSRLAHSQRETLGQLRADCSIDVRRVPIEFHLKRTQAREATQRARGFGFLALGAVTAALAGLGDVHVYENGIGAISLPYTAAQAGTQATKAMHPETLRRASELFSHVLDQEVKVTDPCMALTKAEMCARLPATAHRAVTSSRSCDTAFASRKPGAESCGVCTSCILRRQALRASGLTELDAARHYRRDAFAAGALHDGDGYFLSAMLAQVGHLARAVQSSEAWPALVTEFPDLAVLSDPLPGRPTRNELVSLFAHYVAEWHAVPAPERALFVPASATSAA